MAIFNALSVTLPIIGFVRNFSGMFLLSIEFFLITCNRGLSKLTHPNVYYSAMTHWGMGGGGTHSYSINLNLNGQTLGGQRWIPFLVQIQDMDLNDHLAKKSSLNSIPTGSNSKNTVA